MPNTCQRKGQRQEQERGRKAQDILPVLLRIPNSMLCWPRAKPLAPPADRRHKESQKAMVECILKKNTNLRWCPELRRWMEIFRPDPPRNSQALGREGSDSLQRPKGSNSSRHLHCSTTTVQLYHVPPFSHLSIIPIYFLFSPYSHFFLFLDSSPINCFSFWSTSAFLFFGSDNKESNMKK